MRRYGKVTSLTGDGDSAARLFVDVTMKTNWRYLLIPIVLAALAVSGLARTVAFAAEPASFRSVQLWVYPEYDDPRLLVMLEGKVVGASLPATIRFLVPAAAEMYSAGSMDAQGNYSGGPPERKASAIAGWDEISYELKTETFRVEYYDPIVPAEPDKKFVYEFRTIYPIADLSAVVQQPLRAENLMVLPKENSTSRLEDFNVLMYSFKDVAPDAPLKWEVSYIKADPHPSLLDQTPAAPAASGTNGWLIAGVALAVVALGAGIWWAVRPGARPEPVRSRAARRTENRPAARFCSQCGARLERPSKFCPKCGTRLD